jgi:hypothetical protein
VRDGPINAVLMETGIVTDVSGVPSVPFKQEIASFVAKVIATFRLVPATVVP